MSSPLDFAWDGIQNAGVEFATTQFTEWIARLRKSTGLKQRELGEKAGVPFDQVRRLEQGENVGLWYIAAILSALAKTDARRGYRKPLERLNHPALILLIEDGDAVRDSSVLLSRRRKPIPSTEVKKRPLQAATR